VSVRESPIVCVKTDELFENKVINRFLPLDTRVDVIDHLIGRGDAWWLDQGSLLVGVFAARDTHRGVEAIGKVIQKYGLSGKVYTMSEIRDANGIFSETILGGLDAHRATRIVECAEARKLCVIFGTSTDTIAPVGTSHELGIKFK